MQTITGADLGLQVHLAKLVKGRATPPAAKLFSDPVVERQYEGRPNFGGFYTSSLTSRPNSDFTFERPISEWDKSHYSRTGFRDEGSEAFLVVPHDETRIISINTLAEMEEMTEKFRTPEPWFLANIDYERLVSEGFDGIRIGYPFAQHGPWNTEQTLWMRWNFKDVKHIGHVEPREPEIRIWGKSEPEYLTV